MGYQGRRIEWRYFRLHKIQIGGKPPSWIISNGHISATANSIHLYSAHRAVIFAIAQLSCSQLLSRQRDHGACKPLNWCKKSGDAPLSSLSSHSQRTAVGKRPSCFRGWFPWLCGGKMRSHS